MPNGRGLFYFQTLMLAKLPHEFISIFRQLRLGDCFALLLILTYTTLSPSISFFPYSISWHDEKRIIEVLILLIVLIQVMLSPMHNKYYWVNLNPAVNIGLLVLLAFAIASCKYATSPSHAFLEVAMFYALLRVSITTINIYKTLQLSLVKLISYGFIASTTFYLVGFYAGYLASFITQIPLQWPLPFIGFSNIRSFNQYQSWIIGFIYLPLLVDRLEKKYRIYLLLLLVNWWILAFASNSRGVIIAWLLAVCLTAIIYRAHAKHFITLQVSTFLVGCLGYYLLFFAIPDLLNLSATLSSTLRTETGDRLALWNTAASLSATNPWLGVGPMHFAWHNPTFAHPHNSILQLLAEWGVPATLMILGISARAGWLWLRKFNYQTLNHLNKASKAITVVLFFTLSLNFGYSLVDGVLVMPLTQVLMFLTIGLSMAFYGIETTCHHKTSRIHTTLSIVALAIIATVIYPEIRSGLAASDGKFSSGYMNSSSPRFWLEGS